MSFLQKIDDDIWIYDGSTVSWYGMPYTTRMTIVRLKSGEIWIHSPEEIVNGFLSEIQKLREIKYLVSPNKIHHLFVQDWIQLLPDAIAFSAPGLQEKRSDVIFYGELSDKSESQWNKDIEQLIFKGSKAMDEVVFFHKKSNTLILTDLIENFHPNHFTGIKKHIAKLTGIISPNGKMPLDWRLSFILGKNEARESLKKMINWNPNKIIISHGECIYKDAVPFLKKSFSWLTL